MPGGQSCASPGRSPTAGFFPKSAFLIDLRKKVIPCPNGKQRAFEFGTTIPSIPSDCRLCPKRSACTGSALDHGRQVRIAEHEPLQQKLRKKSASPAGRAHRSERRVVEHRLAHLAQKQGPRARYRGTRKNLFDLRRYAAVLNLETIQRVEERAAA